jgi:hypothetical protein
MTALGGGFNRSVQHLGQFIGRPRVTSTAGAVHALLFAVRTVKGLDIIPHRVRSNVDTALTKIFNLPFVSIALFRW